MRFDMPPTVHHLGGFLRCFALVCFIAITALAQPSSAAETVALEGTWMFRADWNEEGLARGWHKAGIPETQWRKIEVPGSWESQGVLKANPLWPPRNEDEGYNGYAWYRRTVAVPAEWNTGSIAVSIGAVSGRDWVYVNGTQVGATTAG